MKLYRRVEDIPWDIVKNLTGKEFGGYLYPDAKRDLNRFQRKIIREFKEKLGPVSRRSLWRADAFPLLGEAREALRQDNPAPFFRLLEVEPELLREESFWMLSIGRWFPRKIHDPQARRNLLRLGKALAAIGGGNLPKRTPAEKQKLATQRKRNHDARVHKAKKALAQEFHAAVERLPAAARRNTKIYRTTVEKIKDRVIAQALASPEASRRAAAKALQENQDRKKKRAQETK